MHLKDWSFLSWALPVWPRHLSSTDQAPPVRLQLFCFAIYTNLSSTWCYCLAEASQRTKQFCLYLLCCHHCQIFIWLCPQHRYELCSPHCITFSAVCWQFSDFVFFTASASASFSITLPPHPLVYCYVSIVFCVLSLPARAKRSFWGSASGSQLLLHLDWVTQQRHAKKVFAMFMKK